MALFGKKKDPPLQGTAQVLSIRGLGYTVGTPNPRDMCAIGLRVQIPGREPYDVTIKQGIYPWELHLLQPGRTMVEVEVDPTDPQKVQIATSSKFPSGPATPPTRVSANVVRSGADLLASGQRVSGVLKSFAATGTTPRSRGMTNFSIPELIDAPFYNLVIELHLPNLAPVESRIMQPVPPAHVPNLAIGLQLPCAVDPANPKLSAVDWDAITH